LRVCHSVMYAQRESTSRSTSRTPGYTALPARHLHCKLAARAWDGALEREDS
jgi:hypothetical protein